MRTGLEDLRTSLGSVIRTIPGILKWRSETGALFGRFSERFNDDHGLGGARPIDKPRKLRGFSPKRLGPPNFRNAWLTTQYCANWSHIEIP